MSRKDPRPRRSPEPTRFLRSLQKSQPRVRQILATFGGHQVDAPLALQRRLSLARLCDLAENASWQRTPELPDGAGVVQLKDPQLLKLELVLEYLLDEQHPGWSRDYGAYGCMAVNLPEQESLFFVTFRVMTERTDNRRVCADGTWREIELPEGPSTDFAD